MRVPLIAALIGVLGCSHLPHAGPDVASFRAQGPRGLETLLAKLDATTEPGERSALIDAVTRVAGQKDAHVSRLYWFDDLDAALAEAKRTHKPVLSLRMLGRLDEELSCANSRFFRTTLYANTEVSKFLREGFVLHWSSERPVPVVTIDFGDGRKVTRTITGNSIHYVLDETGKVIDALPGLYGPEAFLETLKPALALAQRTPDDLELAAWHQARLDAELDAYNTDLKRVSFAPAEVLPSLPGLQVAGVWPSSRRAVPIAMPKAMVEMPMIRKIVPDDGGAAAPIDPTPWEKLAKSVHLDAASRALVLSKNPLDVTSASAPKLSPALADELVTRLEQSIAMDTVRNEYALHAAIHRWLSENPKVAMKDLNREVYARLFLTPATDPWLGLVPTLTWTGLPNDGIEISQR